jgi:hypothetical protein
MTKSVPLPPFEVITELIEYDQQTGFFTWKKAAGAKPAGAEAGCIDVNGYRRIRVNGRKYQAQRLAWLLVTREDPGDFHIDHINSNPGDNSFANLRLANNTENACNRGAPKNSTSGYKGVTWKKSKNKWNAQIQSNGVKKNLGYFDTAEDAHAAYCEASEQLHGNFARAL